MQLSHPLAGLQFLLSNGVTEKQSAPIHDREISEIHYGKNKCLFDKRLVPALHTETTT